MQVDTAVGWLQQSGVAWSWSQQLPIAPTIDFPGDARVVSALQLAAVIRDGGALAAHLLLNYAEARAAWAAPCFLPHALPVPAADAGQAQVLDTAASYADQASVQVRQQTEQETYCMLSPAQLAECSGQAWLNDLGTSGPQHARAPQCVSTGELGPSELPARVMVQRSGAARSSAGPAAQASANAVLQPLPLSAQPGQGRGRIGPLSAELNGPLPTRALGGSICDKRSTSQHDTAESLLSSSSGVVSWGSDMSSVHAGPSSEAHCAQQAQERAAPAATALVRFPAAVPPHAQGPAPALAHQACASAGSPLKATPRAALSMDHAEPQRWPAAQRLPLAKQSEPPAARQPLPLLQMPPAQDPVCSLAALRCVPRNTKHCRCLSHSMCVLQALRIAWIRLS